MSALRSVLRKPITKVRKIWETKNSFGYDVFRLITDADEELDFYKSGPEARTPEFYAYALFDCQKITVIPHEAFLGRVEDWRYAGCPASDLVLGTLEGSSEPNTGLGFRFPYKAIGLGIKTFDVKFDPELERQAESFPEWAELEVAKLARSGRFLDIEWKVEMMKTKAAQLNGYDMILYGPKYTFNLDHIIPIDAKSRGKDQHYAEVFMEIGERNPQKLGQGS